MGLDHIIAIWFTWLVSQRAIYITTSGQDRRVNPNPKKGSESTLATGPLVAECRTRALAGL